MQGSPLSVGFTDSICKTPGAHAAMPHLSSRLRNYLHGHNNVSLNNIHDGAKICFQRSLRLRGRSIMFFLCPMYASNPLYFFVPRSQLCPVPSFVHSLAAICSFRTDPHQWLEDVYSETLWIGSVDIMKPLWLPWHRRAFTALKTNFAPFLSPTNAFRMSPIARDT